MVVPPHTTLEVVEEILQEQYDNQDRSGTGKLALVNG
jgi:hypothetical protein